MNRCHDNQFVKVLALVMACIMAIALSGCGETAQVQYEVPSYQGQLTDGQTISDFNPELFYRNQKYTNSCDPFVLDNTSRDGYYYVYGTEGSCFCYRSADLMNWEPVGNALDNLSYMDDGSYSEIRKVTWDAIYAPEVIYDPDTQLYYMFFSANPVPDSAVKGVEKGDTWFNLLVATSAYPYKDFQLVDFTDPASCGEENVRQLNTKSYPQYYAKYDLLDPEKLWAFCTEGEEKGYDGYGGYPPAIDPHPFVDDNGDKYLQPSLFDSPSTYMCIGLCKNACGYVVAASIVAAVPVTIIFVFLQRYFIQGLTSGAVKG